MESKIILNKNLQCLKKELKFFRPHLYSRLDGDLHTSNVLEMPMNPRNQQRYEKFMLHLMMKSAIHITSSVYNSRRAG